MWNDRETLSESEENLEIERKFLMASLPVVGPDIWYKNSRYISQYNIENDKCVMRIRRVTVDSKHEHYLTIKERQSGDTSREEERQINVETFMMLIKGASKVVHKIRHRYYIHGESWDIDTVIDSTIGSFILGEVEIKNPGQMLKLPDCVDREVTQDPQYKNENFALPYGIENNENKS